MGKQGTTSDWRRELLERLGEYEEEGTDLVTWNTACDAHVCPRCAAREGRVFTIEEARRELEGEFCRPRDPDDRCRCQVLPAF